MPESEFLVRRAALEAEQHFLIAEIEALEHQLAGAHQARPSDSAISRCPWKRHLASPRESLEGVSDESQTHLYANGLRRLVPDPPP